MTQKNRTDNSINTELLQGIARGEKALAEGRVVRHTEAIKRLAKWLKPEQNPTTNPKTRLFD